MTKIEDKKSNIAIHNINSFCRWFSIYLQKIKTMKYRYKTVGTCSQQIEFELDGDILKNVNFYGGCNGNLQGISKLVEGMPVAEVIKKLEGIRCGYKTTSCPDQLTTALKKVLAKKESEAKNQEHSNS